MTSADRPAVATLDVHFRDMTSTAYDGDIRGAVTRSDEADDSRNSRHDAKSPQKTGLLTTPRTSLTVSVLSIYCSAGCVRSNAAAGIAATSDGTWS